MHGSLAANPRVVREDVRDDGSGMYRTYAEPPPISYEVPPGADEKRLAESLAPRVAPRDPNAEVLARLDAMGPAAFVDATVTLDDLPADWDRFASLQDDDIGRSAFVEERKAALTKLQEPLVSWLAARCDCTARGLWLVNQVQARVPAGLAREILSQPSVRGLSLNQKTVPGSAWDGSHSQDGTRMTQFFNAQLDGRAGNRVSSTNNIRVGIMEAAMLNRDPALH